MALFGKIFGGDKPAEENKPEAPRQTWLQRLRSGLARSSGALTEGITAIFTRRKLDADAIADLEDTLIRADLGSDVAAHVIATLRATRYDKESPTRK